MPLLGYIRQIIRFYSLPQQLQVYQGLLGESKTLARHYWFYKFFNRFDAGYLILALYGFRVAAQYYVGRQVDNELVAFSATPNHLKNIDYICSLSDGQMVPYHISWAESRPRRLANMVRFASRMFSRAGADTLLRGLRIIHIIDKRYGWVQAINISTFLFSTFSFNGIFATGSKVCFTANDFSPVPLAFKYAAACAGLKQIFTMHGQISSASSGNVFPRLDYDIAFLYGKAALRAYEVAGECGGAVVFTGFPGESLPIHKVPQRISRIGVCLANYYDDGTAEAIYRIASLYPDADILVRAHPRMSQNLLLPHEKRISFYRQGSIKEFAEACNFVVAGNTGAQLDLLKHGCPVAHYPALDKLGVDDIGLVADGVVLQIDGAQALDSDEFNNFFDRDWTEKFRCYDSLYLATEQAITKCREDVKKAYNNIR